MLCLGQHASTDVLSDKTIAFIFHKEWILLPTFDLRPQRDAIERNNDLVWDITAFNQRQRAIDFVMGFENKLCVFSNPVEQLYTNYNIFSHVKKRAS